MKNLSVLLLVIILTGCCARPWKVFRQLPPPDESYRTGVGGTHGYDVYIWNCYDNKRVVVYSFSAEMSCKNPEKEETECGGLTPLEKELKDIKKDPVPDMMRWPTPKK